MDEGLAMNDERIIQLLVELREGQKEQLAFSRDVTQRSLDAQHVAMDIQRRSARLYKFVVSVTLLIVVGLAVFLYSITY